MSFFGLTINLLSHSDAMHYSCTKSLISFPARNFPFNSFLSAMLQTNRATVGELIQWCSDDAFVTHESPAGYAFPAKFIKRSADALTLLSRTWASSSSRILRATCECTGFAWATLRQHRCPSLRFPTSHPSSRSRNMSGDPEQDYFADGIVEEIITALSHIRLGCSLIARNSSGEHSFGLQAGHRRGSAVVLQGNELR